MGRTDGHMISVDWKWLIQFGVLGSSDLEQYAILLVRVSLGLFFAIAGANKLFVGDRRQAMYETLVKAAVPFPRRMTYFVSGVEFVGGSLVTVGVLSQLVQERFPVGRYPSCGSRYGLTFGMRMRRKQLHALDHPPLLEVVEPILTRLETDDDRMPCRCRMLGCMLARRTVAATDAPALRAATEMKPPTFRRRQAFHTPIATRFGCGVDSA
jgi:hypothetical protein